MGLIDSILKASAIVAVAIVSTAAAYHYLIYIPQRDAALDLERRSEAIRAREERAGQERRAAAEEAERNRRTQAEKYEADELKQKISARYEQCNSNANFNYNLNWNARCKRGNELERSNHENCLAKGTFSKADCDQYYKVTTTAEDCALPTAVADNFNRDLAQAKDRCLREYQLGLH